MSERRVEVVMSWGGSPEAAEVVAPGRDLVIGDAPGLTFLLPEGTLPDAFVLVGQSSTGASLRIPAGAEARAMQGDEEVALGDAVDGVRSLALTAFSRAEVSIGAFTFFVTTLDGLPEKPAAAAPDWRGQRWLAASFAVHAVMLATFFFMPPNAGALSFDLTDSDTRYIRTSLDALALETPPPVEAAGEEAGATSGEPMSGDEGAAGAVEDTRHTGGQVRVRGETADTRVPLTAADVASSSALATIQSALMASMASSITSPYGAADATGAFDQDAYGSLMADAAGFSAGGGGFGMRGTGRGAGGLADGTIGWGGIGSGTGSGSCTSFELQSLEARVGHDAAIAQCASGARGGRGVGTGVITGPDHRGRIPGPIGTSVTTTGGLSRDDVRRVVSRQRSQIRFCYEQGLASRPDLSGRVSVRWIVSPDGRVSTSSIDPSGTDIRAAQVESCVAQTVSRWTFPASDGPTAVTYPFVLTTHE